MNTVYVYRVYRHKKFIGTYTSMGRITRKSISTLLSPTVFKQEYGRKYEEINIPIKLIPTDDGIFTGWERVLDLSKKSDRQISELKKWGIIK